MFSETDRLRAALAAALSGVDPLEPCPPASDLQDGWHGALPIERLRAVVDHLGRCAACAEAWPLGGRTPPPAGTRDLAPVPPRPPE